MKPIIVLIVYIIGLACCIFATPSTNQLYSVCRSTVDWLRTDENALTYMKYDEEVSSEFIKLLESDESSVNICGLLAVRDTGNEFFLGGLVKAVGAIVKVASGAGRVAGRVASNAGRIAKTAKAVYKGAKIGRKVGKAIRDHDDRKRRRRNRNHHRITNKEYAQLI